MLSSLFTKNGSILQAKKQKKTLSSLTKLFNDHIVIITVSFPHNKNE